MAKHLKSKKSKKPFIIISLIFACITLGIILYTKSSIQTSKKNQKDNFFKLPSHTFSNVAYLDSQIFTLTVNGGISTINGTIINNSDEIVNNLKCLYTLTNDSNDIIYTFDISINNIEPHASSSFTCMVFLDLSDVVDYSANIIEK